MPGPLAADVAALRACASGFEVSDERFRPNLTAIDNGRAIGYEKR